VRPAAVPNLRALRRDEAFRFPRSAAKNPMDATRRLGAFWTLLFVAAPAPAAEPPRRAIRLRDVTAKCRIAFRHHHGASGERSIVETVAAGLIDLDNDGRVDAAVLNAPAASTIPRNESETGNHWLPRRRGV